MTEFSMILHMVNMDISWKHTFYIQSTSLVRHSGEYKRTKKPGAISRGLFKGVYLKISLPPVVGDSDNFGWVQIATGRTNHSTSLNTEICHIARQTKPIKTFQVCDLFLYSRHLYFQLTSEKKKKCKMLFNVWVACKSRYLPAFVYWVCEGKSWGGHLLSQAEGQNTLGEK